MRTPEKIYDSIINGGILKNCHQDPKQSILEQAIGTNLGSTNSLHLKKLGMNNKEIIFN